MIDLTSKEVLDSLLGGGHGRTRGTVRRLARTRPTDWIYPALRHKVGPCRCGRCKACLENARWERIFQEKFADPEYYSAQPPRGGSSLNW